MDIVGLLVKSIKVNCVWDGRWRSHIMVVLSHNSKSLLSLWYHIDTNEVHSLIVNKLIVEIWEQEDITKKSMI